MADPRNVAHDKKVQEEKKHHHEEITPAATHSPQPGKKPPLEDDGKVKASYQQHAHNKKSEEAVEE